MTYTYADLYDDLADWGPTYADCVAPRYVSDNVASSPTLTADATRAQRRLFGAVLSGSVEVEPLYLLKDGTVSDSLPIGGYPLVAKTLRDGQKLSRTEAELLVANGYSVSFPS